MIYFYRVAFINTSFHNNKSMKKYCLLFLFICLYKFSIAQNKLPELLIRVDDIGMNHSVNTAIKQLAETGIPFSTSVMFACPWYQEAVAILKQNPHVDVGVHLTLTAEWKFYRWGPVLGKTAVPSLVDSLGFFLPATSQFLNSKYKLEEVEKELAAQIERALATGLKISYIDPHMGVALATPQLQAITEKLARKYNLGISVLTNKTYYGETYTDMWGVPIETKKKTFMDYVNKLQPGKTNLVVIHIAHDTPEMNALVDMNSSLMNTEDGKPKASKHRQTELDMLLSNDFRNLIDKRFKLTTYGALIKKQPAKQ